MSAPTPVRLQTSVWNPMGARRALLLHGLGSDSSSWWAIASGLADDGFMVLAPDLRSHGRSPPAVDHGLAAFAEDVLLLGEAYDLVIGHSLGGAIAACLLARPCFSAAAVLIDPVLVLHDRDRHEVRAALRADVGELDPDAYAREQPRWSPRDIELKVQAAGLVAPGVVDAVLDHNDPWDLTGLATRWSSRTHLLAADPRLDAMLDKPTLEKLRDGIQVSGEFVTGCGHSVHRERPDVVLEAVRVVLGS